MHLHGPDDLLQHRLDQRRHQGFRDAVPAAVGAEQARSLEEACEVGHARPHWLAAEAYLEHPIGRVAGRRGGETEFKRAARQRDGEPPPEADRLIDQGYPGRIEGLELERRHSPWSPAERSGPSPSAAAAPAASDLPARASLTRTDRPLSRDARRSRSSPT